MNTGIRTYNFAFESNRMMLCFQNPDGGDDETLPPFRRQDFESTRIGVPNEKSDLQ